MSAFVICLDGSVAAHLDVIRRQDTGSLDDPAQNEIDGDTTGYTDEPGHSRVPVRRTLLVQDVGTLDDEGVLQVDEVDLVGFVLHEVLETGAESVEQVASGLGGLVREESELLELGQEDVGLGLGERGQGSELLDDGTASSALIEELAAIFFCNTDGLLLLRDSRLVGFGSDGLGGDLGPRDLAALLQPILGVVLQVAQLDKRLDHVIESCIPQSPPLDRLRLGDVVELPERRRVSVGVADEVVSRVGDRVRLGLGHEVFALDGDDLAVTVEHSGVSESEEDTTGGPAELVPERVVGSRSRGESTTHGDEAEDLASLLVNVVDCG
jgi:hypothetical protein